MRLFLLAAWLLFAIPVLAVDAPDAADRKFIESNMTEGEVLLKIGAPDNESIDSGPEAKVVVKTWVYYPAARDPQTLTTITFAHGRVIDVEREISR